MRRLATFAPWLLVASLLAGCQRSGVDHVALRDIVGNDSVVLLSTAWCGYCRKLRGDLATWGVPFRELDVEASDAGARAWTLLGARAVPVLLVDRDIQHGYAPGSTRRLLQRAGLLSIQ